MIRKFVELQSFQKAWDDIGLTDDDLFELETKLLVNPRLVPYGQEELTKNTKIHCP